MKRQLFLLGAAICVITAAFSISARSQTNRALQDKQMQEDVDTAKFKKAPPYKIGVSAGYLSNSWVVFCLQHIRYEASLHPEITDIIVTDAAFNPTKQVADIEDLISNQPDPGTGRSTTRRSNRC
jgi:ABC-type sugar transport system substrate-binding protein